MTPFENLYYKGERRLRPRVSGQYAASYEGAYLHVAATSKSYDHFQYDPTEIGAVDFSNLNDCQGNGGNAANEVELVYFELWTAVKQRIRCVDTASNTIFLTGNVATVHSNAYGYVENHRFLIENVNRTPAEPLLSFPKQWFFDRPRRCSATTPIPARIRTATRS